MSGLLFREENVKITEDGKEALIRLSQVSHTAVFQYVHCRNSPVFGPLYIYIYIFASAQSVQTLLPWVLIILVISKQTVFIFPSRSIGVFSIFLRVDRSTNEIHKPRALSSIKVFFRKYFFYSDIFMLTASL